MDFILLINKQGKVRLVKWYREGIDGDKIIKELSTLIPMRKKNMSNIYETGGMKVIYKRFASLYFIVGIGKDSNELIVSDMIQRYVEVMDREYGNVCELDIVFNYQLAYNILNELVIEGKFYEPSYNISGAL